MQTSRYPDLRVLSVAHDIGDRRIGRIARAAEQAGLRVAVRACGDISLAPDGVVATVWDDRPRVARIFRAAFAPFTRRAAVLVVVDPDLIPAALLARALGVVDRLVVDVHEDYSAVAFGRSWIPDFARTIVSSIAPRVVELAKYADVVVVADHYLAPASGRVRLVVDNRPTLQPLQPNRRPRSCVYVGDVTSSRGLNAMVKCMALAPEWTLDLVGPIADIASARGVVADAGVEDRIRIHGRLDPAMASAIMRRSEVGFVMLEATPAYQAATPSKLYEYFEAGLAVIATPLPRISELLTESLAGETAADAHEAAEILARWANNDADLRDRQRAARLWAEGGLPDADPFEQLMSTLSTLQQASRPGR